MPTTHDAAPESGSSPIAVVVTVADAVTPQLQEQAGDLLARALPADLVDDRFDGLLPGPPAFLAAVAIRGGRAVAYLGGSPSRGRLQLDGLVDPSLASADAVGDHLLTALGPGLAQSGAGRMELWGRPATPWHEGLAGRHELAPVRALHQMRCPLPVAVEPLPSRPYTPADRDELLAVNNRAFAHHPDQGAQTAEDLAATMAEPWFRPEGLRIHEREGRLAGFCWTKIHPGRSGPAGPLPELGEIYVIGVDPDFHGQGLGGPMTVAGLRWLHEQGITTGMLYVEAENEPAVRTYHRLGFSVVRTDRAWGRPLAAPA